MSARTDEEILEYLEQDPSRKCRERLSCAACGSKDHVKPVLLSVPQKEGGNARVKVFLCIIHRKEIRRN